jgi:hypothetical protein
VLGVKVVPETPLYVDEVEHEDVEELYHSTVTVLGPVYVTVAISDEADCPTSYESGPAGATLTVGSASAVTMIVAVAVPPSESVTLRQ